MDIVTIIANSPPFTKFYLTMIFITALLRNLVPILPTYWYFAFSIKQIVQNHQYWRFLTNFLVGEKFSLSFLFLLFGLLINLSKFESDSRKQKRYSFFIISLLYICSFIIIFQFVNKFLLGIKERRTLQSELVYAFYAISSVREPHHRATVFFVLPIKNMYFPIAITLVSIFSGGSIQDCIVGFKSGYIYILLNDYCLSKFGFSLIYVPSFIAKLFKEKNKIIKKEQNEDKKEKKKKEPYVQINPNDSTNTAFRERGSVAEGNEFVAEEVNQDSIRW